VTPLDALELRNGTALARLRAGGLDTDALLVQLLTTSCLLEVSKLLSSGADLGAFARGTLEVLTRFAPIDCCAIRVEAPGVPPVRAVLGDLPAGLDDGLFAAAIADRDPAEGDPGDGGPARRAAGPGVASGVLRAAGGPVGYLAAVDLPAPLAGAGIIERLAEQISEGLTTLVEAERSRRRLAAARAVELASQVDENYDRDRLAAFVASVAELPNAVGARLAVRGSALAGDIVVAAGLPVEIGTDVVAELAGDPVNATTHQVDIDEQVRLTVELRWAMPPADAELGALATSVESLVHALRRAERAARLLDEAETDELTGLGNRRRALRLLSAARTRAERDDASFAVLILDLDHFKRVNDTLGHAAGDAALMAFASMLRTSIRDEGRATRWGGEEFLVVCADSDATTARALAGRLLELVPAACASVLPSGWRQTVSIGIACYPDDGDNPTAVVHAADEALYRAKRGGRNAVAVASSGAVVGSTPGVAAG
jgi:diguanylate cyclase (GGDEF)-like protein